MMVNNTRTQLALPFICLFLLSGCSNNESPVNSKAEEFQILVLRNYQRYVRWDGKSPLPRVKTVQNGIEITLGKQGPTFDIGNDKFLEGGVYQLAKLSRCLQDLNVKIKIRDHTAWIPEKQYQFFFHNLEELSLARALAVKEYFVNQGFLEEQITTEAYRDNELLRKPDDEILTIIDRTSIIVTENLGEVN